MFSHLKGHCWKRNFHLWLHCVDLYVQPQLDVTPIVMITFDLWMSRSQHDNFSLIINFLLVDWKPHHVTIGLFEANDIMGMGLAKQLEAMLEKFGLTSKVLCYVKDN